MTPPDPGPGPMLTDQEARAYAHLAGATVGNPFALTLNAELAGVLLKALDELNDRRGPGSLAAARGATHAADKIRAEEQAAAPLTIRERAAALGRRLDFTLIAGSNLEVAELARAFVDLHRAAPFDSPLGEVPDLEDTRDVVVDAASHVRETVELDELSVDLFTGRLERLGNALNALGEALDVHESA